jgi:hypothetical protein
MDEEGSKKPMKYKILEKTEVNKVISENEGNCQEIVRAWQ